MHTAAHARSTAAPCLLLLANAGLLSRTSRPTHLWSQNPAQILVPTRQRCTTSEGPWLYPDLVGKWSPSLDKALPFHTQAKPNPAETIPFLPQTQTNTILLLKPSSNPLYSSSLDFPNTPILYSCSLDSLNTPILSARPLSPSIPPGRSCCALYNPRPQQNIHVGTPAPLLVMISSVTQTSIRTTL